MSLTPIDQTSLNTAASDIFKQIGNGILAQADAIANPPVTGSDQVDPIDALNSYASILQESLSAYADFQSALKFSDFSSPDTAATPILAPDPIPVSGASSDTTLTPSS